MLRAVHGRYQDRVFPSPEQSSRPGRNVAAADACPGILDLHEARDGLVAGSGCPAATRAAPGCCRWWPWPAGSATGMSTSPPAATCRSGASSRMRPPAWRSAPPRPASCRHPRTTGRATSPRARWPAWPGHPDLRGLVRALDRAILADPGLAALPGRFLFSLDDGTGHAGIGGCDVGLRLGPGAAELVVAGRLTGLRGPAAAGIRHAAAAARAFLDQRQAEPARSGSGDAERGRGQRARGRIGGRRGRGRRSGRRRAGRRGQRRHGPAGAGYGAGCRPGRRDRRAAGPADHGAGPARRAHAAPRRSGPADCGGADRAPAGRAGRCRAAAAGRCGPRRQRRPRTRSGHCVRGHGLRQVARDVRALAGRVPGLGAVHWAGAAAGAGCPPTPPRWSPRPTAGSRPATARVPSARARPA